MRKNKNHLLLALLLVAGEVLVDQILKLLVRTQLQPIQSKPLIPGLLALDYLENRGAAFGIFQNRQWFIALLTGIICICIVVFLVRARQQSRLLWVSCVLILGGGIGNILDRLLRGYVVDYMHFLFFPYIFNFADICVVVGVGLLILHLLRSEREDTALDSQGAEKHV